MIVIFRSCEANISAGSLGSGTEEKPRWLDKYKKDIIRKCWKSLQPGLSIEDTIYIVNDRTTVDTLQWMKETAACPVVVHDIPPLTEIRKNHPYPNYHPVVVNDATPFTEFLVEIAEKHGDDLIYICEDDYLHIPIALSAMKWLFLETGYNGFYVPYDYPDRYTLDREKTAEIVLGKYGHLRTVPCSTYTMASIGNTFTYYKHDILQSGVFAQDNWTYKAFRQFNCYSPLPGHATHLQDNCITPSVNWLQVWDNITI